MVKNINISIDCNKIPNVLLLGNGMLKLGNTGTSWDELIAKIRSIDKDIDYSCLPYAMQPEAVCGVDVEDIQRRIATEIKDIDNPHSLLYKLLEIPFDAIITTNYTYEIEKILSGGKWSSNMRRKAFTALDGNSKPNHNTYICNVVTTTDGRYVPVFHVHGEYERKHSMILSYYSYAKILSKLIEYNKMLGNSLFEHQQEMRAKECRCWLDYFILGNIYSVGFGLDVSEFDIWWAIERKAREKAEHGKLLAYLDGEMRETKQSILLDAMNAKYQFVSVSDGYEEMYNQIISDIKEKIKG
ncbi:MAG: hypothetical protein MJ105_03435 [Lachnospiraceae bacterium]|nr:hypothetical protein [Lachnospiraceae bacterium]